MSYTALAVVGVVAAAVLDLAVLRTRLLGRRAFWVSYAIVVGFQLLTNGILTGLRVVRYDPAAIAGPRIAYAPVEDLLFGFALVLATLSSWVWWGRRLGRGPRPLSEPRGNPDGVDNLERIEEIALALPEAERVDIESWGGEPTFRVRNKNFVFAGVDGDHLSVKLPKEEAAALVATDPAITPVRYGLGRHGWVSVALGADEPAGRWELVSEWIRTSYALVAPRTLARLVDPPDRS